MPGLRIHHPTMRNCVIVVPHPGGSGRAPKDYQIKLDNEGECIVSQTIWERLKEAQEIGASEHGFILLNEVPDPPRQVLNFGKKEDHRYYKVVEDVIREMTPPGMQARVSRANTIQPHKKPRIGL